MESDKSDRKYNQLYLVDCNADASPAGAFHVTINRKNFTFSEDQTLWLIDYLKKYSAKDCYAYCVEKNKDGSTHLHFASLHNKLPHNWRAAIRKHFKWDNNSKTINIKNKYTDLYTWRNVVGGYLSKSTEVSHKGIHPSYLRKGKVTYTDHVTISKAKKGLTTFSLFPAVVAYAKNHGIKSWRGTLRAMYASGIPFGALVGKLTREQYDSYEQTFNILINGEKPEFNYESLFKQGY